MCGSPIAYSDRHLLPLGPFLSHTYWCIEPRLENEEILLKIYFVHYNFVCHIFQLLWRFSWFTRLPAHKTSKCNVLVEIYEYYWSAGLHVGYVLFELIYITYIMIYTIFYTSSYFYSFDLVHLCNYFVAPEKKGALFGEKSTIWPFFSYATFYPRLCWCYSL